MEKIRTESIASGRRPESLAALEGVFRSNRERLIAHARRMMRDEQDAQDVVQQAFANAIANIDSFAGKAQLSTWLHRIVTNTALMALRSKRRRRTESLDALTERVGAHSIEPRVPADFETSLDNIALRAYLKSALGTLPPLDRALLHARVADDSSTLDAASALGISCAAARTRLHRARHRLAQALRPNVPMEYLSDGKGARARL